MVKCSHLTVFLKDLEYEVDELNLSRSKVNIDEWISRMNQWQNNNRYGACYSIFTEMIDQIIQPFAKNSCQLTASFGNKIGFKQFRLILNYNECFFNLNESWGSRVHRRAVIDFLIESFIAVYNKN